MFIVWHFHRINFIWILFFNFKLTRFRFSYRKLQKQILKNSVDTNGSQNFRTGSKSSWISFCCDPNGINLKSNLGDFFDHVMCFFRKPINRNCHFQISFVLEINWSTQLRWQIILIHPFAFFTFSKKNSKKSKMKFFEKFKKKSEKFWRIRRLRKLP